MELIAQAKLDAALAREHAGLTQARKLELVHHLRGCRPEKRAELHQILSEGLAAEELAFYNEIVVPPRDDTAAAPEAQPSAPEPAPEAAATAVSEGARAAESTATRSRPK